MALRLSKTCDACQSSCHGTLPIAVSIRAAGDVEFSTDFAKHIGSEEVLADAGDAVRVQGNVPHGPHGGTTNVIEPEEQEPFSAILTSFAARGVVELTFKVLLSDSAIVGRGNGF